MNSRTKLLLFALFAAATLPQGYGVRAQTISSPYAFIESKQEAGVFVGAHNMGTGRFGFGPGPGTSLGAKYGVNIAGPFGLEGVVTYIPTTRDIVDPGRDEGDRVVGEGASDMIVIDGRLRFSLTGDRSWHGLSPFVLAGGGFVFDVSNDKADQALLLPDDIFKFGTSFLGVLGTGIRWFPGDRWVVRGDAILNIWQLDTPIGYSDPERAFVGVDEKEWVSGASYSLGFGFRF